MIQCSGKQCFIKGFQTFKNLICPGNFHRSLSFQNKGRHHRHIGKRQNKSARNGKNHRLRHGSKHLSFYARKCQNGQVNQENYDFPESRCRPDFTGGVVHFCVHLTAGETLERNTGKVMHGGFHNNDGPIYDQAKVDGSKTHKISRHAKKVHAAHRKQHGKRDDRGNQKACPEIAEE